MILRFIMNKLYCSDIQYIHYRQIFNQSLYNKQNPLLMRGLSELVNGLEPPTG